MNKLKVSQNMNNIIVEPISLLASLNTVQVSLKLIIGQQLNKYYEATAPQTHYVTTN